MSAVSLWTPDNTSIYSSVFNVPAGQVCLLFATGLDGYNVRTDVTQLRTPRTACLRRLLFSFDKGNAGGCDRCGWVFDVNTTKLETLVDSAINTCGLPWQLTLCRNIGIIGVPGSYRMELSDATVVGTAQVYAELYDANSIPAQAQSLFF